jgi:hypothetical protein
MMRRIREPSSTELIYLKTATQVVSRSSLAGHVTHAQFTEAVAALERHFAILRAAVRDQHFVERQPGAVTQPIWLSADDVAVESLCESLLDHRLDLSERLYEAYAVAAPRTLDVVLVTSHAVTDATALIEMHACLAYFCDAVVRGLVPAMPVQEFPDTIDGAVDKCLAALGMPVPTDPPRFEGEFLRLPERPRADAAEPVRHRLERLEIEPALTHAVADASHSHGVSVHAVLAAAFVLAIREFSPVRASQALLRSSVDMRRRLEPHVSAELVFSAITAHVSHVPNTDGSIFDIARTIFDDIKRGTTDGRIFHDYENYPRLFGVPDESPAALNISDIGVVRFRLPLEALEATGFEYATGWLKTYPNTSISIFNGKLVAATAYRSDLVTPETMARLSELVRERLQLAAASQDNDDLAASGTHGLTEGGLVATTGRR